MRVRREKKKNDKERKGKRKERREQCKGNNGSEI